MKAQTSAEKRVVLFFGLYRVLRLGRDLHRWFPTQMQARDFLASWERFNELGASAKDFLSPKEVEAFDRFLHMPFRTRFRVGPWSEQAAYLAGQEFSNLLDAGIDCLESMVAYGLPPARFEQESLLKLLGVYWQPLSAHFGGHYSFFGIGGFFGIGRSHTMMSPFLIDLRKRCQRHMGKRYCAELDHMYLKFLVQGERPHPGDKPESGLKRLRLAKKQRNVKVDVCFLACEYMETSLNNLNRLMFNRIREGIDLCIGRVRREGLDFRFEEFDTDVGTVLDGLAEKWNVG